VRSDGCSDRRDRVRPAAWLRARRGAWLTPRRMRFATVALLSLAVLASGVALGGGA
jgi:hypothetical protein